MLAADRWDADAEVQEHVRACVLANVDRRLDPALIGDVGDERRVLEILRTDSENDCLALVGSETGMLPQHGIVEAQPVRAELRDERAVRGTKVGEHEIHRRRADELGYEEIDGSVVELGGDVELLENAVAEHRDSIAEGERLHLVVGDVNRRHVEIALEPRDLRPHLDPELGVEVREGLVHKERLGLAHDRAAHRDPLSLPARERPRLLLEHIRQAEHPSRPLNPRRDLRLRQLPHLERERDVRVGGHVRIEGVVLEDHRDVAVLRRNSVDDLLAQPDSAVGDLLEPSDHPERGRLAAARGPDEDHELGVGDLQVERVDGLGAVPVDLRQLLELDLGHRTSSAQPETVASCTIRAAWKPSPGGNWNGGARETFSKSAVSSPPR